MWRRFFLKGIVFAPLMAVAEDDIGPSDKLQEASNAFAAQFNIWITLMNTSQPDVFSMEEFKAFEKVEKLWSKLKSEHDHYVKG